MPTFNAINCATALKNTGYGKCVFNPAFVIAAIRVPDDFEATQAQLDDLQTLIRQRVLAANIADRFLPIYGFKALTDNSEDTTFQTFSGDGTQVPVRDGNYNLTWQYLDGGLCLHMNLRSWNYQPGTFLFLDAKRVLFGWRKEASDGSGEKVLAGVPCVFHANKWRFNTGSEVANYSVYFSMDSSYLNDSLGFVQLDFDMRQYKGLQTIALKSITAPNAGVSHIQAVTGCDNSNLYDTYSTELASAALWIAKNAATGAVIDITSVTADATTKAFIVTLDSTDANYPTTTTAKVTLQLVDPTALDVADITGFESNILTIARG